MEDVDIMGLIIIVFIAVAGCLFFMGIFSIPKFADTACREMGYNDSSHYKQYTDWNPFTKTYYRIECDGEPMPDKYFKVRRCIELDIFGECSDKAWRLIPINSTDGEKG